MIRKIIITAFSFFFLSLSYAHPLDISISIFELWNWEKIKAETFIHFFEVWFLFEQNWIKIEKFDDIFEKKEIFENYIKKNATFKNNWKTCSVENFQIKKQKEFEVYSDWLKVDYKIICPERIKNLWFENKMFIEDFELQTNKMFFFRGALEDDSIYEKILTSKIYSNEFSVENPGEFDKDSDWDWLFDKEEIIYWTEVDLMDSDFDKYSDWLEVQEGWNPLNPEASPGQNILVDIEKAKKERLDYLNQKDNWIKFEKIDLSETSEWWASQEIFEENKEAVKEISKISSRESIWGDFLKNTLELISNQIWDTGEKNFYLMILLVFMLWALHVLAPGHWKGFLAAYLLEKSSGFKVVLKYSLIFTFAHLIDVLVIAVLIKVFSLWATIWAYIWILQKIWIIGLFIFSSVFLYNSFKNHKNTCCSCNSCKSKKLFDSPFLLWIFSWIAPCSYGWVLFLTVLSLWKIEWLFPVMWIFAFWIFLTIFTFWASIVMLKVKTLWKYEKFTKYSWIISGFILFWLSFYLLLTIF